jgi:hypothetical protein
MIFQCIEKAYIFHASLFYAELQYGYLHKFDFDCRTAVSRCLSVKCTGSCGKNGTLLHTGYILSITVFFRKDVLAQCGDWKSAVLHEEAKTGTNERKFPAVFGSEDGGCISAQQRADSAGSGACALILFFCLKDPVNTMGHRFPA